MVNNLEEIKQNAFMAFEDRADDGVQGDPNSTRFMNNLKVQRVEQKEAASKTLKEMLKSLTQCVEHVGYLNPMFKVYQLTQPLNSMPLFMAVYSLAMLKTLVYDMELCTLRKPFTKTPLKNGEVKVDGPHLLVGIITLFRQFHNINFKRYIQYLCHYYRQIVFMS